MSKAILVVEANGESKRAWINSGGQVTFVDEDETLEVVKWMFAWSDGCLRSAGDLRHRYFGTQPTFEGT